MKERKYQKSVQTRNIIQTFIFQKIKSDFDFDHPFGRYGCFKRCTIGPILALFPIFQENQIFSEHGVFTKICPLSSYMIFSKKSTHQCARFSLKCEKLSKRHFSPHLPKYRDHLIFFQKSGRVTVPKLPFPNSTQKIRKFQCREI